MKKRANATHISDWARATIQPSNSHLEKIRELYIGTSGQPRKDIRPDHGHAAAAALFEEARELGNISWQHIALRDAADFINLDTNPERFTEAYARIIFILHEKLDGSAGPLETFFLENIAPEKLLEIRQCLTNIWENQQKLHQEPGTIHG